MIKLLIITLLLIVAIRAEEIGVPYVEEKQGLIQSAVLAPDWNSFYTLKDDLVTKWQLSPIKKLLSFETSIDYKKGSVGYQINVSNDNKRVILYSSKEIQLWDIQSQKHLKTVKENLYSGVRSKYGFLTIGEKNVLRIWDDKSLTLENSIDFNEFIDGPAYSMLNGDNILIVNYFDNAISFDLNTLKIIDMVRGSWDGFDQLDVDMNTFTTKVKNKYSDKFNPYNFYLYMKDIGKTRLQETISSYKGSTNSNEIVLLKFFDNYRFAKASLEKSGKFKKRLYHLYQFDNTIILRFGSTFTGAGNFKKYVKMKTKDGKILPINNATFKEYNKNINLKD